MQFIMIGPWKIDKLTFGFEVKRIVYREQVDSRNEYWLIAAVYHHRDTSSYSYKIYDELSGHVFDVANCFETLENAKAALDEKLTLNWKAKLITAKLMNLL